MEFIPVILGMDVNAYGIARSVHMAYGVTSVCIGQGKLFMTQHSSICSVHTVERFMDPDVFPRALVTLAKTLKTEHPDTKLIIFAASDAYAELVIRHRKELEDYYALPFCSESLLDILSQKSSFYKLCENKGFSYPKTTVVSRDNYKDIDFGQEFPLAIKPSDSVRYAETSFEGKKKAYIGTNASESAHILDLIYTSGYDKPVIIQDFIPGPDSNMRVVNAYVDTSHSVRMMCLGHPLLEDVTPSLIGNYVAIISESDDSVYQECTRFLQTIKYTGFANFDLKFDPRDNSYKIFEINLRPGRSSFYTTLAGCNLMKAAIDDLIFNTSCPVAQYGHDECLWLGVPEDVAESYIEDPSSRERVRALIQSGRFGNTLDYPSDSSFLRNHSVTQYYKKYAERFRQYFEPKGSLTHAAH